MQKGQKMRMAQTVQAVQAVRMMQVIYFAGRAMQ